MLLLLLLMLLLPALHHSVETRLPLNMSLWKVLTRSRRLCCTSSMMLRRGGGLLMLIHGPERTDVFARMFQWDGLRRTSVVHLDCQFSVRSARAGDYLRKGESSARTKHEARVVWLETSDGHEIIVRSLKRGHVFRLALISHGVHVVVWFWLALFLGRVCCCIICLS
jgi:hypothetical protein